MTTPLSLATHLRPDGAQVLTAVGEIDMSNADSFLKALNQASAADGRPVVVDLTGVEYLDSAGLTVLFTHASHIELIATPLLAPVLTISGLADITRLHGIGSDAGGSGAGGSGFSANPG
jgi:anti-sigma B factor antagonist